MKLFISGLSNSQSVSPPIELPIVVANDASAVLAVNHLDLPTSDGSGQNVHPSIAIAPNGISWNGYKYWMAMTPYPYSSEPLENPEIIASNDKVNWFVPTGLTNPIYPWSGISHNSDPDLLFYNNRLYCYFNGRDDSVVPAIIGHFVMSSSDGINWGTYKKVLADGPNSYGFSPSVLRESDGTFSLWNVVAANNTPRDLRRFKCDTPDGEFVYDQTCTFTNLPTGRYVYHLDINNYGNKYHAVFTMGILPYGGSSTNLYFATSDDGIAWDCGTSVLLKKDTNSLWQSGEIYRSSMLYNIDNHTYDLYYSAAGGGMWHTGLTTINL